MNQAIQPRGIDPGVEQGAAPVVAAPRYTPLDRMAAIMLAALPFAKALTINVGFPLKVSELAIAGAIAVLVLTGGSGFSLRVRAHEFLAILAFIAASAVSLLLAVLMNGSRPQFLG